jgi:hypothetical protein
VRFEAGDLERIARVEEVEIETGADGDVHRTVIWAVVDGGDVFVRSVRGPRARWYREATAGQTRAIHVNGRRLPCRIEPADDPKSIARCTDGLRRKYQSDPALGSMVQPHTLPTTLRVEHDPPV